MIIYVFFLLTILSTFVFLYFVYRSKSFEPYIKEKYGFKKSKLSKKKKDISINIRAKEICKDSIFSNFYIAYIYNIIDKKERIIEAIIIKWLNLGIIRINVNKTASRIDKLEIIFNNSLNNKIDNDIEKGIYDLLYGSSKDGIINYTILRNWCKRNYYYYFKWIKDMMQEQRIELTKKGLIKKKRNSLIENYVESDLLKRKAFELIKFKDTLLHFDANKDKMIDDNTKFDNYLPYIFLFGISEAFYKENKKVCIELMNYTTYQNLLNLEKMMWNSLSIIVINSMYVRFQLGI